MPTFEITDKASGRKFRITGASKEGALAALKSQLAKESADTPEMAARRRQGLPAEAPAFNPGVEGYDPQTGTVAHTSAGDKFGAFTGSVLEGVPVAGPSLRSGAESVAAGLASTAGGGDYATLKRQATAATNQEIADNPNTAMAGQVVGAVAPMVAGGSTVLGGRLLGTTGSLLARTAAGAGSNAVISGADTAARGGDLGDILKSAGIGGAVGGLLPAAGDLVGAAYGGARDFIKPKIGAVANPAAEAERRAGAAYLADKANTGAPVLTAADEAAAARNGQQLLNVDRGGENTLALARSAANNDPSARRLIANAGSDRFASQGDRAISLIDRLTGGAADDMAMQDMITSEARKQNSPAYRKAETSAAAQDMSDPELLDMLRSPAVRKAAADAEKRSSNRAVAEGTKPVKSPFVFAEDGSITMQPGVKPTLRFWDQVKRNLDGEIGVANRAGDKTLVSDLTALKSKLVSHLDAAVPDYKTARQGAAAFFDAEDALDAGKKFVTQNRNLDETARALSKMKPAERVTFAVGFASELKDLIKQARDRTNVIDKIFGSPQARAKVKLALGDTRYHEFEQFVKVENAMDQLRGAMGNSKTAQYIIESGLAGVGTGVFTGDWRKGIGAAAVTGLARKYGMKIDQSMAKQVAKLLLSDNPTALNRAAKMAAANPKAAQAVENLQKLIGLATRGIADTPARQPLQITVGRPQPSAQPNQ